MINIIDTFQEFRECFEDKLDLSIDDKIRIWQDCYISKYPELEKKCKDYYEEYDYSWKSVASELVFKRTKDDFNKMIKAHGNILEIMEEVNLNAKEVFNLDLQINIVLYCGLCNSAGWVDYYNGKRTILYGIDKIAELNWHTIDKLKSLLSHELCHVIHFEMRGEDYLPSNIERNNYNEGIWFIYGEGFAQFFQSKLLGSETDSRGSEWINKCKDKESQLKKLYLESLYDKDIGTRDFFGDWFKVLGISDVGYFLGAELIKELTNKYNMKTIAQLQFESIEKEVIDFLTT